MISTWRKRRSERKLGKKESDDTSMEVIMIPSHFRCPISLDLMKDPVTLSTGITYDRESIEKWIEAGNGTCPITNQVLKSLEPIPNHSIRKMMQQWCVENRDYGIQRIPTPRTPMTSSDVSGILSEIESERDSGSCRKLVSKVKAMAKESERNKLCFMNNGTRKVLSSTFLTFLDDDHDNSNNMFGTIATVLDEILSTMTMMLPLDVESKSILIGSKSSLRCMVWFLKCGSLSSRRNAVLMLKEVLQMGEFKIIEDLLSIEGSLEALVKLVKEPICPTTTKASLLAMYHMVSSSHEYDKEKARARFADLGLVELLLELLVDCDKSVCEKALGVLDGICSSEQGRQRAYGYALTMPVLVKKLLRVSDLATEFSVSILWKLLGNNYVGVGVGVGGGLVEGAIQVGAFQKLLLLLQVGCSERTKDMASELLKLLNVHRDKQECIDSLDFKNLKRPFL